ncbi:MAG: BON domain-containing protein [Candidatus Manganitrophaceae bacterium]|nr:MAG: BON domain-containing protein [Candidatus Manganitrophaceae bacterium]
MARTFGARRSFFPSVLPSRTTMLLAGLTLGILFAPRTGRSSRALIAQRYQAWMNRLSVWFEDLARKTRQQSSRVQGTIRELREKTAPEETTISDEILSQRVRSELGRFFNTAAIEIMSQDGVTTLKGAVGNNQERQDIVEMARRVRGVREVISLLS